MQIHTRERQQTNSQEITSQQDDIDRRPLNWVLLNGYFSIKFHKLPIKQINSKEVKFLEQTNSLKFVSWSTEGLKNRIFSCSQSHHRFSKFILISPHVR